jgi:hypothetical protein
MTDPIAELHSADIEDMAKKLEKVTVERNSLWCQLVSVRGFVASDKMACSYHSMGQYRTAVLELLGD